MPAQRTPSDRMMMMIVNSLLPSKQFSQSEDLEVNHACRAPLIVNRHLAWDMMQVISDSVPANCTISAGGEEPVAMATQVVYGMTIRASELLLHTRRTAQVEVSARTISCR